MVFYRFSEHYNWWRIRVDMWISQLMMNERLFLCADLEDSALLLSKMSLTKLFMMLMSFFGDIGVRMHLFQYF